MDSDKRKVKQIAGLIVFTMLVYTVFTNYEKVFAGIAFLWDLIFPFVLGAAIAFLLNLPMRGIEKLLKKLMIWIHGKAAVRGNVKNGDAKKNRKNNSTTSAAERLLRPVSLLLTFGCVIAVISIVIGVVLPQLINTMESIGQAFMAWLPQFQAWLQNTFADNPEIEKYIGDIRIDWVAVFDSVKNFIFNGATNILSHTFSATMGIISGVTTFFIAVVFACYILMQKEKLESQARRIIKVTFRAETVEKINYVASLTHRIFCSFITGQCLEACILGFMFFVCMLIFRLPYALLIAVLIAFTALIPIVGAFIGCIVGALLILLIDPFKALFFVIMFLVLQQIEGNLIYPHVVGGSVGLPSIWVLMAVTIGGSLMGIVGMLVFIPLVSVIYSLIGSWVRQREKC
ncbi:MAG: AI-2E family transporter [Clostridia bacterium]|nr:AI-2E family transporter [[Bacteroides] pectinophilus]MDD5873103.1 AI-2E family transporter [Clostridia bacterium]